MECAGTPKTWFRFAKLRGEGGGSFFGKWYWHRKPVGVWDGTWRLIIHIVDVYCTIGIIAGVSLLATIVKSGNCQLWNCSLWRFFGFFFQFFAGIRHFSIHNYPRVYTPFRPVICICWSPNWNEPQTDSGTPRFGNRFGESLSRYGDPRSDMGSPFWMPFQFGDETIKSQIGTNPKPILVSDWTIPKPILGSPFWYGDVLIPILVRGSGAAKIGNTVKSILAAR